MRRILAVGMAGLLAFTITTTPLSAADLGMPVKAAPITEAPPPDYTWLWWALGLAALGVGIWCAVDFCEHHGGPPPSPQTTGGNNSNQVDISPILRGSSGIGTVAA
jgi:hypothetical protein